MKDGLVTKIYQRRLQELGYRADAAQFEALTSLDACAQAWQAWQAQTLQRDSRMRSFALSGLLRRWHKPLPLPQGVYLYGSVGRGKSFLMDCFFEAVPIPRKTRLHFHELMREVHAESLRLSGTVNPLFALASKIAQRHQLICFDEFHLNSMADAMILENLLQALYQHQVGLIMTSNFAPEDLYPDCLHRERLDAAIRFLRATMAVVPMLGTVDHRRTHLNKDAGPTPYLDAELTQVWQSLSGESPRDLAISAAGKGRSQTMTIAGRAIAVIRAQAHMAWFDFSALCESARSKGDFLELSQRYHTILLQGVPKMPPSRAQAARRFTLLIDVLYDRHIHLYVSAAAPYEELYTQGQLAHEFARTVSRLYEMHSAAYRAQAARTVDTGLV